MNTKRHAVKVAGPSGSGINISGEILARALKRSGYCVFAYREYPSLIKGGYSTYQIDFSPDPIKAVGSNVDIEVALTKETLLQSIKTLSANAVVVYDEALTLSEQDQAFCALSNATFVPVPLNALIAKAGAQPIMKNTTMLGVVWKILDLDPVTLEQTVGDMIKKGAEADAMNRKCVEEGFAWYTGNTIPRLNPQERWKLQNVVTGNHALSFGAVAAGVRAYFSYPMTPASSILTILAKLSDKTGMLVKQAEDEITAANLSLGAMHAGTRAFTATSGGGFDLMTETLSMAAIAEVPFVCVIAQRPGPATGVPTYTTQGDLNLAVHAGHGEFARLVLAMSDGDDAFYLMATAFNYAEKYRIPVIVLTEKHIAESLFTIADYDATKIPIDRGKIVSDDQLSGFTSDDHYRITDDGVSARWLPGQKGPFFLTTSYEHRENGDMTEDAEDIKQMIDKRMRKEQTLFNDIPDAELIGPEGASITFVGWGSSAMVMTDVLNLINSSGKKVNYLHYTYLNPLKTERLERIAANGGKLFLIENNFKGQLGELLETKAKIAFTQKLLKYDGRPFFLEEVLEFIEKI
ncbi:MAG: 2-oxoacid:acceptor oxidoreductase subunit alpha [bacterium]